MQRLDPTHEVYSIYVTAAAGLCQHLGEGFPVVRTRL